MSQPKNPSRRSLLKGSAVTAAAFAVGAVKANASPAAANCIVGFDNASYTVNNQPLLTSANPGAFGANVDEHKLNVSHFVGASYASGGSAIENRHMLAVEVGLSPLMGVFHPTGGGGFANENTITDIYVFNKADNSLLFWKKLSSNEPVPAAMFTLSAAMIASPPQVTVVARCSAHGYWATDFDMSAAPLAYDKNVGIADHSKLAGGCTLLRPWLAPLANGGQGDLGTLHRPNIIVQSRNAVKLFLGGATDGTGKHGRYATNHYLMGGILFDQNGNTLGSPRTILYSNAADQQIVFSGFDLELDKVTTIRAVCFDALHGRLMGFLDVA